MRTAIRYGLATYRLAQEYNNRLFAASNVKKIAGVSMYFDTGDQSTVSGNGLMHEKFQRTGLLQGYTDCGMTPRQFGDPDYDRAALRSMCFDETFMGMKYNVTKHKFSLLYFCIFLFYMGIVHVTLFSHFHSDFTYDPTIDVVFGNDKATGTCECCSDVFPSFVQFYSSLILQHISLENKESASDVDSDIADDAPAPQELPVQPGTLHLSFAQHEFSDSEITDLLLHNFFQFSDVEPSTAPKLKVPSDGVRKSRAQFARKSMAKKTPAVKKSLGNLMQCFIVFFFGFSIHHSIYISSRWH